MGRRRRKDEVNIDLTSLLDVIFLLLIVVLLNQKSAYQAQAEEVKKEYEDYAVSLNEVRDEKEELAAKNRVLEQQLDEIVNINENVAIVTVYADYTPSDPSVRNLWMAQSTSGESGDAVKISKIELTKSDYREGYNTFKTELTAYLDENREKPVLMTVDTSQILYRDYVDLSAILLELNEKYPNLYQKAGEE